MNFEQSLTKKAEQIDQIIKEYLPKEEGYQKIVLEAMNYSILAGGKRIRPMLMQEVYTLFGGEGGQVEPFMAAIEMIHTYSLVHDDLPAMDDDDYRRGRKTTHVVYGEGIGILAGDALLNYAFETALSALTNHPQPDRCGQALQILAKKAGIYGMIGGQTADVYGAGKALDKDELDFIYRLKTGALVESAMMIGAVLAGADEPEVKLVEQAAADVGMAFQIQDDILDITSTTEELGKPVHSDEKNDKTTYVTLYGLERSKQKVKEISGRAIESLNSLGRSNPFLFELLEYLIYRKK